MRFLGIIAGAGVYGFANGDVYEGEFHEHKFHGQGVLRHANSEVYEGGWCAGQRSGVGEMRYCTGDWYKVRRRGMPV